MKRNEQVSAYTISLDKGSFQSDTRSI